jgi:hypothetical protein
MPTASDYSRADQGVDGAITFLGRGNDHETAIVSAKSGHVPGFPRSATQGRHGPSWREDWTVFRDKFWLSLALTIPVALFATE